MSHDADAPDASTAAAAASDDAGRESPRQRPLASPEQERLARDLFPVGAMSPGAYAARHGVAGAGCAGYERLRYRDARLERWLQAVAHILATPALLERVRARDAARRDGAP